MVGMQASLHTAREDSLRDLMKSEDDPMLSGNAFDENLGGEIDDDFNPDALLMSPLFNDSAGKLDRSFTNENEHEFGRFEETHDTLLGRPDRVPVPPPAMEYPEPGKQRPMRPAIVRESRNVKLPTASSMHQGMPGMGSGMMSTGRQQQQHQHQSGFAGYNSGMPVPSVIGGMDSNFHQVTDDSSHFDQSQSNFDQSQSDMHDYNVQSYRSPTRRMPDRSISSNSSYQSECDSPVMGMSSSTMYHRSQHQMITPARSLPPKSQSYAGPSPGHLMGSQSNDLSVMRQQLQHMRDLEIRDAMQQNRRTSDPSTPGNLSQSMHLPVQRTASATSVPLSRSMHYDSRQGQATFNNGMPGSPSFPGSNVSIASDSRSFKPSFNQVEGAASGSAGVNDAMEKLCESMKRSAMSRQMVKQYGSSSSRGISRHGSGPLYGMRQASGRNNAMDDSSGRSAPVRRLSSTKHQLHHPMRGVYRNDSSASNGHRSFNFQVDGRNMGGL